MVDKKKFLRKPLKEDEQIVEPMTAQQAPEPQPATTTAPEQAAAPAASTAVDQTVATPDKSDPLTPPAPGMVPTGWAYPEQLSKAIAMKTGDVDVAQDAPDVGKSQVAAPENKENGEDEGGGEIELESLSSKKKFTSILKKMIEEEERENPEKDEPYATEDPAEPADEAEEGDAAAEETPADETEETADEAEEGKEDEEPADEAEEVVSQEEMPDALRQAADYLDKLFADEDENDELEDEDNDESDDEKDESEDEPEDESDSDEDDGELDESDCDEDDELEDLDLEEGHNCTWRLPKGMKEDIVYPAGSSVKLGADGKPVAVKPVEKADEDDEDLIHRYESRARARREAIRKARAARRALSLKEEGYASPEDVDQSIDWEDVQDIIDDTPSEKFGEAIRGHQVRRMDSRGEDRSWKNQNFEEKYRESARLNFKELLSEGLLG